MKTCKHKELNKTKLMKHFLYIYIKSKIRKSCIDGRFIGLIDSFISVRARLLFSSRLKKEKTNHVVKNEGLSHAITPSLTRNPFSYREVIKMIKPAIDTLIVVSMIGLA